MHFLTLRHFIINIQDLLLTQTLLTSQMKFDYFYWSDSMCNNVLLSKIFISLKIGFRIPNTMTLPPPNLAVFLVHFALNLSPIHLFTLFFFTSFPNKLNLLSSLKNTFTQFSYVQITYLFANSNLFFFFFELTSGFFLGVRLNSPISCSRLETVCLDTLTHEVLFITLLISVQDLKRSFNDIRCIIWSSLAVVLRGLPVLKALTILPVSL